MEEKVKPESTVISYNPVSMAWLSKVLSKVVFAAPEQRDRAHLQFHSAAGWMNRKLLVVLGTSSIYATYQVSKMEVLESYFVGWLVC